MRSDALGFFWRDEPPPPRVKKEVIKRTPPERTWESADYLPGLAEARAFNPPQMTQDDLVKAVLDREPILFDIECYKNFFLIAFISYVTGKCIYYAMTPEKEFTDSSKASLKWIAENLQLVGFNSNNYDMCLYTLAVAGKSCATLKFESDQLIQFGIRSQDILRKYKVKKLKTDHIDLLEVAPLRASLKVYAGRLHAPRMQDLPFPPEATLTNDQQLIVFHYCFNDLVDTAYLRKALTKQLALRDIMSQEYRMDLRSKSDAQIAEAVIAEEVGKLNRTYIQRPKIEVGTTYRYKVPPFLRYQSHLMHRTLALVEQVQFVVDESGAVGMPQELKDLQLTIGGSVYRMGIGGLHSSEKRSAYVSDSEYTLYERDVVSYYPFIILNLELFPEHLGYNFLRVYRSIVERRLAAKAAEDFVVSDSLKITINGSFGKLGSKYSVLYSPDLLIQVTITGQLSLLMLIERLELQGIQIVSANTDGVVIRCPKDKRELMLAIVKQWEFDTGFETEENLFKGIYSRDVNNYIAVKQGKDGKLSVKPKGAYAPAGLQKNPTNTICNEAIALLLTEGIPIEKTITECRDITKFVNVRTVKGGAVKVRPEGNEYLGKAIRWYYAAGEEGEIVYASTGNKVPRSDGAKPLMQLAGFPDDVNYDWYIEETNKILKKIGYL